MTKKHWTEQSSDDFLYRIISDYILQIQDHMAETKMSRNKLAEKLGISPSRVSQVLNGYADNLTLGSVIDYARAVGLKVSLVAYDDADPDNVQGPVNAELFRIAWETCGRPRDLFDIRAMFSKTANSGDAEFAATEGSIPYYAHGSVASTK